MKYMAKYGQELFGNLGITNEIYERNSPQSRDATLLPCLVVLMTAAAIFSAGGRTNAI